MPDYWRGGAVEVFFTEDTLAAGIETRPDQINFDDVLVALVLFPVRGVAPLAGKELCSTPSEDCKQMKLISARALFWL